MKSIIFFICVNILFVSNAQLNLYNSNWVNDTIDFSSRRVFLSAPELSVKYSIEYIAKGEGKSVYFPLRYDIGVDSLYTIEALYIDCIVNTSYDRMMIPNTIDIELWNTFNKDHVGSRCYLNNNKYNRIDLLFPGIVIYYEGLSKDVAEIADKIIQSIHTISNSNMLVLNKKRRKYIVDSLPSGKRHYNE